MSRADHSSRGALPSVVWRSEESLAHLGAVAAWRKDKYIVVYSTYIETLRIFLLNFKMNQ